MYEPVTIFDLIMQDPQKLNSFLQNFDTNKMSQMMPGAGGGAAPPAMPAPVPEPVQAPAAAPLKLQDMQGLMNMLSPPTQPMKPPGAPGVSNPAHQIQLQDLALGQQALQLQRQQAARKTLADLIYGSQHNLAG